MKSDSKFKEEKTLTKLPLVLLVLGMHHCSLSSLVHVTFEWEHKFPDRCVDTCTLDENLLPVVTKVFPN